MQITFTGTYIDGFAGPQEVHKPGMWAAKLVLESSPRWLKRFILFELAPSKIELLEQLRDDQPPRDKDKKEPKRRIDIYAGDFNANVANVLAEDPIKDTDPTFCLLDQRTFECHWETVRLIASHKKGGNKIELFYFFPEGWVNRSIAALRHNKSERLLRWWGNNAWNELIKIQGASRAEYVCKRFKLELRYKHVYPFPIYERKNGCGRVMYYMIHASDHDEAPSLMSRAYGKALDLSETSEQLEFLIPTKVKSKSQSDQSHDFTS